MHFRILCKTGWLDLCLLKLHTVLQPGRGSREQNPCKGFFWWYLILLLFTVTSEHIVGILKYGQVTQLVSVVLAKR